MSKPFLILQLRPETEAADGEFAAILGKGQLSKDRATRIRLDRDALPAKLDLTQFAGVILGGGPGCISDDPATKDPIEAKMEKAMLGLMPAITEGDIPFMGCCAGIGVLAHHLGAPVSKEKFSEDIGPSTCTKTLDGTKDALLADLPGSFDAFVGHKEAVQDLPTNCAHLLSSPTCPFQMIRYKSNVYATQFHPEADADEFETRIKIYKNKGYFAPEAADDLIAMCRAANVTQPERILRKFVQRYG